MKNKLSPFELLPEDILLSIAAYAGNRNLLLTSKYLYTQLQNTHGDERKKLYHPRSNFHKQLNKIFYHSGKKAFIEQYGEEWLPESSVNASYENDIIKDYYSLREALTLYYQDIELLLNNNAWKTMLKSEKLVPLKNRISVIQFEELKDWVHPENVAELRGRITEQWFKTFTPITLPKSKWQPQNEDLLDIILNKIEYLNADSTNADDSRHLFNSLLLFMQYLNQARQDELILELVFDKYWTTKKSFLLDLKSTSAKLILKICGVYSHRKKPLIFYSVLKNMMLQGLQDKEELKLIKSLLNPFENCAHERRFWLESFMCRAVEYGHLEAAKLFFTLGQKDLNIYHVIQNDSQELRLTLVELAIQKNNLEMLNFLLAHKADPNLAYEYDSNFKTIIACQSDKALIRASRYSGIEFIEALLRAWKKMPDEETLNKCMDTTFINFWRKSSDPYLEIAAIYLILLPNLNHSVAQALFAGYEKKKNFMDVAPEHMPDDQGVYPAKSREFLTLYLRYYKYLNVHLATTSPSVKAQELARPIRLFGVFKAYEAIEGAEKAASFKQKVLNLAKDMNQHSLATDVVSLDFYFGHEKLTKLN